MTQDTPAPTDAQRWVGVCFCGWESPPQPTSDDAESEWATHRMVQRMLEAEPPEFRAKYRDGAPAEPTLDCQLRETRLI